MHISPIETFDSGATPKPGQKRIEPKNLADVDLDALSRFQHNKPFTVERTAPPQRKQEAAIITTSDGELKITPTQQRILDGLAFYESININKPTNAQLGAVALIDASGGYFGNVTTPLTAAGLIVREGGRTWLTDEGRNLARVPENMNTLDDYHEQLRARVRQAKNASNKTIDVLNVIINANGEELSSKQIGEAVGIDHTGGYFGNVITPLSTIGLIERRSGVVRPTEVLFPPGL